MALTLEDVDRILDQAEPELLQRLKLDVRLTALLVRDGVISASLADTLDAPLLSRMDKVHRFLQDLRMGPIERFLKFCRVLQEDGKPHLLEALHVDFDNIISQLGSTPSTSLLEPAREAPESHVDNRDLFLHQRQFYKEVLSKVPIYEYVMRSEFIQIDDVFTKLELVTNDEDETPHGGFLSRGSHAECELHPVSGRVPLLVLMYQDMGGIAFLTAKAMKYPTSWIYILVSSPTDITADTAENIDTLKQFAKKKRGKVDVVDICIKHSGWNWDFSRAGSDKDDSCAWKKAIILVNDMFRPKWGVVTTPDYPDLLTEDDLQELRHMGVKMLLLSEPYPD